MKLKDACVTGGIVNAAKAVELAYQLSNQKLVYSIFKIKNLTFKIIL